MPEPGRAGGGEEMGGTRGVMHYMQRTAVQGSPARLTQLTKRWVKGAPTPTDHPHPFTRDFDTLASAMADRYRVVCPDVAGRGDSDWLEDKGDYSFSTYLSDAAALIARITAPVAPDASPTWRAKTATIQIVATATPAVTAPSIRRRRTPLTVRRLRTCR